MPRSTENFPGVIKINHQYKNTQSGTWHAFMDRPGELYVSVEMLLEGGFDPVMMQVILESKGAKQ